MDRYFASTLDLATTFCFLLRTAVIWVNCPVRITIGYERERLMWRGRHETKAMMNCALEIAENTFDRKLIRLQKVSHELADLIHCKVDFTACYCSILKFPHNWPIHGRISMRARTCFRERREREREEWILLYYWLSWYMNVIICYL